MIRCLIFLSLLLQVSYAQKVPQPDPSTTGDAPKKWLTLNGGQPEIIARGGFSGIFPESSAPANQMALDTSLSDTVLLCNLQLTQDGFGICLPDIRLDNTTTAPMVFPKGKKTYKVNGQDVHGWFALDYPIDQLLGSVNLIQNIFSRPSLFDGLLPISSVEDAVGVRPKKFWLSVQNNAFYAEHKLSVAAYLQTANRVIINYISSPEIGFLKSISGQINKGRTKLIFEFKELDATEPTINKKYSAILQDLASIKVFASGILVPKEYIWPVDANRYLKPATTLVADAHKLGLEVYASGFANDKQASYNYSYNPVAEYLQFIDTSQFAVDGLVTDFPPTASEAVACFAQQNPKNRKQGQALIITHNGASGVYPGSTDLAYQQAVNDGADIIDCSVQMSKDGVAFCSDSADLMASTTAMTMFMSRAASIPEIQNNSGIYSFDLTWSEIQSVKPQIQSPFGNSAGFLRNPANKNVGKLLTFSEFLEFAKTKAVTGIFINIENAAYLASKKGLGIVDAVKTALSNATFDKQSTQKVLIQSDDSSVLSSFQDIPAYTRVLNIQKEISSAPKQVVEEIKKVANAVTVPRPTLITVSNGFATAQTKVVEELHAANVSVFVSVMRNEYVAIAFDYFSDPIVELATFIAGVGIDGVITDYPATAVQYMKSPCSNLNSNLSYSILPAQPGGLMSVADPQALPPAAAPNPALTPADVIDPPLPPVADVPKPNSTAADGPAADAAAEGPGSSGVANGVDIVLLLSLVSIVVVGLLF